MQDGSDQPEQDSPQTSVVTLASPTDVDGFRSAARGLFGRGVEPDRVHWRVADAPDASLFDGAAVGVPADAADDPARPAANGVQLKVPPAFVVLTESVSLHRDPQRFDLLYRLLWRLQHEPGLRRDPLDPQWLQASRMAQAVHREHHKMKAFVRFRPIARGAGEPPLHVAWFEPEHHVVEAAAPFFMQRFAQIHWSILTPLRSAAWDGERLVLGPGARPEQAPPADAGEALWLTYYQSIFNPARLKLAMMRREMPRRYWINLPEAALIEPLAAGAQQRTAAMIDRAPAGPERRIPAAPAADGKARDLPAPVTTTTIPTTLEATTTMPMPITAPLTQPAPPAIAIQTAPDAAPDRRHADLLATHDAARACTNCPLYAPATQVVFGEGPVDAALMFVGEQPGDQEDVRGRPFVGPAGQLFARALDDLQVDRKTVYVTNAVKHFKFEMRGPRRIHKTPTQQEAAACHDWLEREIALVKPKGVVALGATAARSLLGRAVAIMKERGQWYARADGVRVFVTLHPSALLRMPPELKDDAHRDWMKDLAEAVRTAG